MVLQEFVSTFSQVLHELQTQRKKALITMHRFLDADAFGSGVALCLILQEFDIESTLLCIPFAPERLKFLSSMNDLHVVAPIRSGTKDVRGSFTAILEKCFSKSIENYGALIILDCAGFAQIPKEAWSIGGALPYKINIDHHLGYELNSSSGKTLNLVEDVSSTCEVLFNIVKALGINLNPKIAVPLYIGMIADLRKNEISQDSLNFPKEAIEELNSKANEADFNIRRLAKTVFALEPWEKYLLKMTLAQKRFFEDIVYVKFDYTMIQEAKEATDSLENPRMPFHEFHIRLRRRMKRFRKGFQVVAIFDHVLGKVSLHSLQQEKRYDLALICHQIGGGGGHGHRAGFKFQTAKRKILAWENKKNSISDEDLMEKIILEIKRLLSEADRKKN